MFLVLQSMGVAKSILKFVAVAEKVFPVAIYGQAGQLAFPHLVMPGTSLLGLAAGCLGTLALTSLDLRLCGTLYATRGGRGKVSFNWGSRLVIVLQCFFTMVVMEGRTG